MNILIIGSGGRENALAWKIKQSKHTDKLFVAPGNAGTNLIATNIALNISDFKAIEELVIKEKINLVIVGPEEPLVKGISDYFSTTPSLKELKIFGPKQLGATLEGSKDFSKEFMFRHNIPTAKYATFRKGQTKEALAYLESYPGPYVLKADGLAAGKGVIITTSTKEAKSVMSEMLDNQMFGEASSKVVVEEFLDGIELSMFVVTDGKDYVVLPEAKDYKRIGEGDQGLNTGGMGALSPVPFASAEFKQKIEDRIIKPTIEGLAKDNIEYVGFIFFGLIKVNNEPMVIEYNVRMGDPETEVVIPRIESDLVDLLWSATTGKLSEYKISISSQAASTVMLVAGGYPGDYNKGDEIFGLENIENVLAFHAGTKNEGDKIVTNGGGVIAMTALGNTIFEALEKSNKAAEIVKWNGRNYRKDIGFDLK